MTQIHDVIVIGAGPAGYTAAIYASRANLDTLLFEGWQPGGQLTTTTEVENFPGFKDGIQGQALMQEMRSQAARFGTEYVTKDVTRVDFSNRPFRVYVGDSEYQAKSIVIATGAKPRLLGLESEKRLWAKGVSSCATCDGFFYKGKTVAVIGGGDSAMEEATFLTKFANKVYLINRSDRFRASAIMYDRAKANDKIEILTNKVVDEVLGEEKVVGLRLKDTQSNEVSEVELDGMFLAIGHIPVVNYLEDQLNLDDQGYLKAIEHSMSSVEGVFIAGDVVDHRYRQAITAAAMGCKAAIDAERWLESQED